MRVWIDIENPPQVQYLLPFREAFADAGVETVITARDYGSTVEMLCAAGVEARVFGAKVGRGKVRKVAAAGTRAWTLSRFFAETGKPDAVLAASRAAALVAWTKGFPCFLICDYEHAHVRLCRLTGSTVLHPEVIDSDAFVGRGLRRSQLVAFKGLKEDLTFAGIELDGIEPYRFETALPAGVRVLFRPPSETSHYYQEDSTSMARETLRHLAAHDALVVFSPREPEQVEMLAGLDWKHEPVVLRRPVPFVSLLKSVDAVVCSGGTMLREAAYLGIPSYSIFQSEIGAVDRWLEQIGRATLVRRSQDLTSIRVQRRGPLARLDSNPELLEQIVAIISGAGVRQDRVPSLATA